MADIAVTASDVKPANARTRVEDGIAGSTITAGQPLYVDAVGKLKPAQAVDATQANVVGIALNNAAPDQPVDYVVQGDVILGSVLTPATAYVLGGGVGAISPSADLTGTRVGTILGMATANTTLRVGITPSESTPAGGSTWTPASLSTLWAWYKSDAGVFQDTGETTPATNNTNVARWRDQSASGLHLDQSTLANRPLFQTNRVNSLPSLTFDSDWLRVTTSGLSDDVSIFIVMKISSAADQMFVEWGKYHLSHGFNNMAIGDPDWGYAAEYWNGSNSEVGTGWRLHTATIDNQGTTNAGVIYLDGTQKNASTKQRGSTTQSVMTLGATAADEWLLVSVEVAELIIMSSLATSTERANVHAYVANRYGLTIS
jgi:hypothetical protein